MSLPRAELDEGEGGYPYDGIRNQLDATGALA